MNSVLNSMLSTNMDSVFNSWRGSIVDVVMSLITNFILPVASVILLALLIFQIIKSVNLRNEGRGDELKDQVGKIILIIAGFVLCATFSSWNQFFIIG